MLIEAEIRLSFKDVTVLASKMEEDEDASKI